MEYCKVEEMAKVNRINSQLCESSEILLQVGILMRVTKTWFEAQKGPFYMIR